MFKKIFIISIVISTTIIVSGCAGKNETLLYFESYNKLENSPGKSVGGVFTFEVNGQRFEVMDGYTAEHLEIIKEDYNNKFKIIIADSDRKELLSITTERESKYRVNTVRECEETDDTVYILYSKWDTDLDIQYLVDLKSTYILEIDMESMEVKKQYDFGVQVVVMTIHDGYVYTIEDGRVYRKLLTDTGNKECMADLGYRGIPKREEMQCLNLIIEQGGIKVIVERNSEYGFSHTIIADIKYTDQPINNN